MLLGGSRADLDSVVKITSLLLPAMEPRLLGHPGHTIVGTFTVEVGCNEFGLCDALAITLCSLWY